VTAYSDNTVVDKCYDLGMVEVLHKPVSQSVLRELINKHYIKEE